MTIILGKYVGTGKLTSPGRRFEWEVEVYGEQCVRLIAYIEYRAERHEWEIILTTARRTVGEKSICLRSLTELVAKKGQTLPCEKIAELANSDREMEDSAFIMKQIILAMELPRGYEILDGTAEICSVI